MARGSGFRVLVDGCTPMSSLPRELVGEVVPSPVVVAVEAPPLRRPPAAPRRGELTSSTCAAPRPATPLPTAAARTRWPCRALRDWTQVTLCFANTCAAQCRAPADRRVTLQRDVGGRRACAARVNEAPPCKSGSCARPFVPCGKTGSRSQDVP